MSTPFDDVIEAIKKHGYHNHRKEIHSDIVSAGIFRDLLRTCASLQNDMNSERVCVWKNVRAPGDRERKIDLLVGEPKSGGLPDLKKIRIALENKSVVTAHRNKDARFDDLTKALGTIHEAKSEAVIIATVLIGLAQSVLNVPDQVKKKYKGQEAAFEAKVLPRLSSGDQTLWEEFGWAISSNRKDDPKKTMDRFKQLPTRNPAHTHVLGYDYVLLVPVYIDNVSPPVLPRPNPLEIDVDQDYQRMLEQICKAYTARWHL